MGKKNIWKVTVKLIQRMYVSETLYIYIIALINDRLHRPLLHCWVNGNIFLTTAKLNMQIQQVIITVLVLSSKLWKVQTKQIHPITLDAVGFKVNSFRTVKVNQTSDSVLCVQQNKHSFNMLEQSTKKRTSLHTQRYC